jgi:hypothetical protein
MTGDITEDNGNYVGFEVLTAVVMKSYIFWDITSCSPIKVNRRFGGTYRLHLQGRRITKQKTSVKAGGKQSPPRKDCHLLSSWFPAWLFFYPEDGGDMFLRNVG